MGGGRRLVWRSLRAELSLFQRCGFSSSSQFVCGCRLRRLAEAFGARRPAAGFSSGKNELVVTHHSPQRSVVVFCGTLCPHSWCLDSPCDVSAPLFVSSPHAVAFQQFQEVQRANGGCSVADLLLSTTLSDGEGGAHVRTRMLTAVSCRQPEQR